MTKADRHHCFTGGISPLGSGVGLVQFSSLAQMIMLREGLVKLSHSAHLPGTVHPGLQYQSDNSMIFSTVFCRQINQCVDINQFGRRSFPPCIANLCTPGISGMLGDVLDSWYLHCF